jgi:hypothetical protein
MFCEIVITTSNRRSTRSLKGVSQHFEETPAEVLYSERRIDFQVLNAQNTAPAHQFGGKNSGGSRKECRLYTLTGGAWHSVSELSVLIDDGAASKINGVVLLQGLRSAYAVLRAACESN